MHIKNLRYAILMLGTALAVCASVLAGVVLADGCRSESLVYTVTDPDTGEVVGTVSICFDKRSDRYRWHEHRVYADDKSDTIDVECDPETLAPLRYERVLRDRDETRHLRIDSVDGRLMLKQVVQGAEETLDTVTPDGPFVVEPMLKCYLTGLVAAGDEGGTIELVVILDNRFKSIPVKWRKLGHDTAEVDAGTFDCLKIAVEPSAWFLKALSNPSVTWLDRNGTNKMVRTPVRRSLLDKERTMELSEYHVGACEPAACLDSARGPSPS